MTKSPYEPLRVAGGRVGTADVRTIRSPHDGEVVGTVAAAGDAEMDRAIAAAHALRQVARNLPIHRRAAILNGVARGLREDVEAFAATIVLEAGKPLRFARAEVERA